MKKIIKIILFIFICCGLVYQATLLRKEEQVTIIPSPSLHIIKHLLIKNDDIMLKKSQNKLFIDIVLGLIIGSTIFVILMLIITTDELNEKITKIQVAKDNIIGELNNQINDKIDFINNLQDIINDQQNDTKKLQNIITNLENKKKDLQNDNNNLLKKISNLELIQIKEEIIKIDNLKNDINDFKNEFKKTNKKHSKLIQNINKQMVKLDEIKENSAPK